MDRDEAIGLLRGGPEGIAEWYHRQTTGEAISDFTGADLTGADLTGVYLYGASLYGASLTRTDLSDANLRVADLRRADLIGAHLFYADLHRADLTGADLTEANLTEASLTGAKLTGAKLTGAKLIGARLLDAKLSDADLSEADLAHADLTGADLTRTDHTRTDLMGANLTRTNLTGAKLSGAKCHSTIFVDVDLSQVEGLDSIQHFGPSGVSTSTLIRSRGRIPEAFLRGCGLSPWEVLSANLYDPEMTPPRVAELQYLIFDAWTKGRSMINGCFISHSWEDAKFVDTLRDRLVEEGVNVWLDRHDMVAGTLQDQLWRAIQIHHVVLLVLSKDSIQSDWVENELDMARVKERAEGRAVLCPVALDDAWKAKVEAKDGPGDPSRGLWRTLTQKLVVDFSRRQSGAFEEGFAKLLRGLKVNYGPPEEEGCP